MSTAGPDELLDAYFSILQGGRGESRAWNSFTDLFFGEAYLRTVIQGADGESVGDWSIGDFVEHARELYEPNGISQIETSRELTIHASTAHAWCGFESRLGLDGASAMSSGVQSIQMIRIAGRWWITGIVVHLN